MTRIGGTPLTRLARGLAIGILAFGVSATALPSVAAADHFGPRAVAERLDRIAWQVDQLRDVRNPYRRDARIDRLQSRLDRLESVTERQRGRLARRNDARIDRLQHRLARMEWHTDRRIGRIDYRRSLHHGHDHYKHWDDGRAHERRVR